MPEGPSIVILKEEARNFSGKKVIKVTGNSKAGIDRIKGKKLIELKSWGKHFLLCFKDFTVKIHFMLFGSYRINEKKDRPERLGLRFKQGELNFYACSVKFLEQPPGELYDWSADVMNEQWDPVKARKKLKALPRLRVCDALLQQDIFAGVGNIIKNEVLFRVKVHPESKLGKLPPKKLSDLIREARNYSFDFLGWKKAYVLKKNWLAHTKKTCSRCKIPLVKKHTGKTNRRSFFCTNCQLLYV